MAACSSAPAEEPAPARTQDATQIAALINPNATAPAQSVHRFLVDNYGKHMLTGSMGGIAWETAYSDFIKRETGSYPAVVGFDFVHLNYSPADWIDYSDITPVKTIWDAGSIPTICWHWRVPTLEPGTVDEDEEEMSYDAKGNDFSCANALKDDTWERKVIDADIAKVAGYLSQLQDAGIPVLFRPLHEAAGDYGFGPWFWWGNSGPEATKQLWVYLYETLTHKYGINNLIWVWTQQTHDKGQPASYDLIAASYPGNEYVDIIGADIYADGVLGILSNQSDIFRTLNRVVDGKKLVTLSECGNLVSPEAAAGEGALWSYFMQWYDMKDNRYCFSNYTGPGQWNTVLGSPYVLSQGQFSLK